MKICIVGASKRFTSGLSYYTICLSNTLAEKADVSTICFRRMLPEFLFPGKSRIGKEIVTNINFDKSINVFDRMDYNNPITWLQVYSFIKEQNPDIIILQWWSASVVHMHLLIKLFARFCTKARIIIEFHEVIDPFEESILPIRVYAKLGGTLLRRNLDTYITHSESDRQLVAERYKINPEKINVVPLGLFDHYTPIDSIYAKQQLSIKEEYVIMSFGLIRRYKGIPYLISAFEGLPSELISKSRLLIVGEIWEDREAIQDQIKASPYRDKITLVDKYIPDDKVNLYFSAASVVVLPYLRASQSGVAHITMTFGKPIIVSRVGGLAESMVDYTGTHFISPTNIPELRAAIVKCSNDYTSYSTPTRDWNHVAARFSRVIENINN